MAKLNAQGLSRKNKLLMETLIPRPGYTFVSCDLSAGEPTVVSHFSRDPNYIAACFGMVGKAPYYDSAGVLQIDDIYIMSMSVSPMGRAKTLDLFNSTFNGMSFSEQWLQDPDFIKGQIKSERAFHKILALGLSYAMGPKHMVEASFAAGYSLSLKDARAFFKAYWELFKEVKRFGTSLEERFKLKGYLINPFGYRLIPDPEYKSLNYFIQSSVTGIMHVLCAKFFKVAPFTEFVTVIHDEIIIEVPTPRVEEAKALMKLSTDSLNEDLNWSVKIRVGWAEGRNLYEAK